MLNAEHNYHLQAPDYKLLISHLPGMYMILLPDAPRFTIVGLNNEFLKLTQINGKGIIGKGLFQAFPDNPNDPNANGVKQLRNSLQIVLETKKPSPMAVQRYDVRNAEGIFEERYWNPVNYPILRDGKVIYIVNQSDDVTEMIKNKRDILNQKLRTAETEVIIRAHEIQEVNDRLREAEAKYRGLFESAQDGIIVVNQEGMIVLQNPQVSKMFGYEEHELNDHHIEILLPERYRHSHTNIRNNYLHNPVPLRMGERKAELWGRKKSGREFPLSVTLSPMDTKDGAMVTAIIRDESETRKLTEEALHAREDAIATVSHDLKNPLSIIVGNINLLSRLNDKAEIRDPKIDRIVSSLNKASTQMISLIQNLLDFSKLEAKCFIVDKRLENVSEIFSDVLHTFMPLAEDKHLQLHSHIEDDIPMVQCDGMSVNRVLSNLLSNAIKFTSDGGKVVVTVEKNDDEILFTVQDTGSGISKEELEHVFDRYWQAHSTAKKGTGLGLAIVKGIVEAHGGKVWVESEKEKGSIFHFTIPMNEVTPQDNLTN